MRTLWLVLRWLILTFGLLLVVAVIGLGVFTRTEGFREMLREKLLTEINSSVPGQVTLGRIEGSIWGHLILINLRLYYDEEEIFAVPRLTASYSLVPLLWGRVQLFGLRASGPHLRLKQDKQGRWNIVEALSPVGATSEESTLVLLLNSIDLDQASIDLSLSETPQRTYRLRGLALKGRLGVEPAGLRIDLRQISSRLLAEGLPELRLAGSLAYQDISPREMLRFDKVVLESGDSRINASGKIDDFQSLQTEAKISLERLAPAEIAHFIPDWPIKSSLTGAVEIKGRPDSLDSNFTALIAGAKISGNVRTDLTRDPLAYGGTVTVSGLNIASVVEGQDLAGVLSAAVRASGTGSDLANINAAANVNIRSAGIGAWQLGDMSLRGDLRGSVATIAGKLAGVLGQAEYRGTVALKEKPRYQLSVSVDQLDLQRLFPQANGLEGKLNLTGTLAGSGLALAEMDSQVKIDFLRSSIGAVELERGRLVATVAKRRIHISHASLNAKDATLTAKGELGVDPNQQGRLDYSLRVSELSPWLAIAGLKGSGNIEVLGRANGNLGDLRAQGNMKVRALKYEDMAIDAGEIGFDLRHTRAQSYPKGMLQLNLAGVQSAVRLQTVQGTIRLSPELPYGIMLDAKARDREGRSHTLAAHVDYQPPQIHARVTRLVVNLPDGAWTLSRPVILTHREGVLLIDRLSIRNRNQTVFLNGQVSLTGSQSLDFGVEGLSLQALLGYLPEGPPLTGMLKAQGRLTGTAAAPELTATAELSESKIAGQNYAGLVAALNYQNQQAKLNLALRQDADRQLNAVGTVPFIVSWNQGWRAEVSGNMDLRVYSSGLSLAFLNAIAGASIQNIGGEISLDLRVQGTPAQPSPRGVFRLRDGTVSVKPLGIKVAAVTADGSVDPQSVRLTQFHARANDGDLQGSGSLALREYRGEELRLFLTARRWPAIHTERYQAQLSGSVQVNGTTTAPKITGKLQVDRADLRPTLEFLEHGGAPAKRDPTIVVVDRRGASRAPAAEREQNGAGQPDLFQNSALDLEVLLPRNVWVRHPNGNAELSGKLALKKKPQSQPELTGSISVVRGWVGFQGRRFELTRGRIEFIGGDKINPALDIVASYRVQNYLVNALVGGTVEKPALTLQSDPQLNQADILALLLFGKPISALDQREQMSLQQNTIDITSGYAATRIGQAVSEALGLENLGIDIGTISFAGGEVRFGRYFGRQTYVTVSQEVSGKKGREFSVEYTLTPEWKLGVTTSTDGSNGIDIIWNKRY